MAVSRGDPQRILAGTDVAGNTCGRSNDPITGVSQSGQSLQDRKYLYYDWIKTAKIIGDQSLTKAIDGLNLLGDNTSVDTALNGVNFDTSSGIARDFCLDGVYTSSTSRLHKAKDGVYSLDEKQFQMFRDSPSRENLTGIVISKKLMKNKTSVLVLLQNDGAFKVWKTSKGTNVDGIFFWELLQTMFIEFITNSQTSNHFMVELSSNPEGMKSFVNTTLHQHVTRHQLISCLSHQLRPGRGAAV